MQKKLKSLSVPLIAVTSPYSLLRLDVLIGKLIENYLLYLEHINKIFTIFAVRWYNIIVLLNP